MAKANKKNEEQYEEFSSGGRRADCFQSKYMVNMKRLFQLQDYEKVNNCNNLSNI